MSFKFQYSDWETDPTDRMRSAIFQALGAASVCWQYPEKAGVFDSTRALLIGEALCEELGI